MTPEAFSSTGDTGLSTGVASSSCLHFQFAKSLVSSKTAGNDDCRTRTGVFTTRVAEVVILGNGSTDSHKVFRSIGRRARYHGLSQGISANRPKERAHVRVRASRHDTQERQQHQCSGQGCDGGAIAKTRQVNLSRWWSFPPLRYRISSALGVP